MSRQHVLVALSVCLVVGCSDKNVLAVVGDSKVIRPDLQAQIDSQSSSARKAPSEELQLLVGRELLAEGARRARLDKDPSVRARLATAEREILAQAFLEKKLATATSEGELRKQYENRKVELGRREVAVQHIVLHVSSNAAAAQSHDAEMKINRAYARVVAGEDFGSVAAEMSDDLETRAREGILPKVKEGQVDPSFFAAAVELKKGETSPPVRTAVGFHVIRALEDPQTVVPPFEAVRGRLLVDIRTKAEENVVQKLREDIGVKVYVDRLPGERK